jgi:NAD(P)H-hydrate epimerase
MFHNYWSEQMLYKLIEYAQQNAVPTLLDAGALRLLEIEAFAQLTLPENLIMTPHPGEAAGLLNISVKEVQADRLKAAKDLHLKFGGIVVLKGHGTIIYDGNTPYLCSVGGPELGIAGSGDVLSGLIGSLVSQGLEPMDAAIAGVALHSGAGNQFTKNTGVIGLAASELIPLIRDLLN